jgi:hypothetical protein
MFVAENEIDLEDKQAFSKSGTKPCTDERSWNFVFTFASRGAGIVGL